MAPFKRSSAASGGGFVPPSPSAATRQHSAFTSSPRTSRSVQHPARRPIHFPRRHSSNGPSASASTSTAVAAASVRPTSSPLARADLKGGAAAAAVRPSVPSSPSRPLAAADSAGRRDDNGPISSADDGVLRRDASASASTTPTPVESGEKTANMRMTRQTWPVSDETAFDRAPAFDPLGPLSPHRQYRRHLHVAAESRVHELKRAESSAPAPLSTRSGLISDKRPRVSSLLACHPSPSAGSPSADIKSSVIRPSGGGVTGSLPGKQLKHTNAVVTVAPVGSPETHTVIAPPLRRTSSPCAVQPTFVFARSPSSLASLPPSPSRPLHSLPPAPSPVHHTPSIVERQPKPPAIVAPSFPSETSTSLVVPLPGDDATTLEQAILEEESRLLASLPTQSPWKLVACACPRPHWKPDNEAAYCAHGRPRCHRFPAAQPCQVRFGPSFAGGRLSVPGLGWAGGQRALEHSEPPAQGVRRTHVPAPIHPRLTLQRSLSDGPGAAGAGNAAQTSHIPPLLSPGTMSSLGSRPPLSRHNSWASTVHSSVTGSDSAFPAASFGSACVGRQQRLPNTLPPIESASTSPSAASAASAAASAPLSPTTTEPAPASGQGRPLQPLSPTRRRRESDDLTFTLPFGGGSLKAYRRHHCRKCGAVVCSDHSSKMATLFVDEDDVPEDVIRQAELVGLEQRPWNVDSAVGVDGPPSCSASEPSRDRTGAGPIGISKAGQGAESPLNSSGVISAPRSEPVPGRPSQERGDGRPAPRADIRRSISHVSGLVRLGDPAGPSHARLAASRRRSSNRMPSKEEVKARSRSRSRSRRSFKTSVPTRNVVVYDGPDAPPAVGDDDVPPDVAVALAEESGDESDETVLYDEEPELEPEPGAVTPSVPIPGAPGYRPSLSSSPDQIKLPTGSVPSAGLPGVTCEDEGGSAASGSRSGSGSGSSLAFDRLSAIVSSPRRAASFGSTAPPPPTTKAAAGQVKHGWSDTLRSALGHLPWASAARGGGAIGGSPTESSTTTSSNSASTSSIAMSRNAFSDQGCTVIMPPVPSDEVPRAAATRSYASSFRPLPLCAVRARVCDECFVEIEVARRRSLAQIASSSLDGSVSSQASLGLSGVQTPSILGLGSDPLDEVIVASLSEDEDERWEHAESMRRLAEEAQREEQRKLRLTGASGLGSGIWGQAGLGKFGYRDSAADEDELDRLQRRREKELRKELRRRWGQSLFELNDGESSDDDEDDAGERGAGLPSLAYYLSQVSSPTRPSYTLVPPSPADHFFYLSDKARDERAIAEATRLASTAKMGKRYSVTRPSSPAPSPGAGAPPKGRLGRPFKKESPASAAASPSDSDPQARGEARESASC